MKTRDYTLGELSRRLGTLDVPDSNRICEQWIKEGKTRSNGAAVVQDIRRQWPSGSSFMRCAGKWPRL